MPTSAPLPDPQVFVRLRPRLYAIAYRMLGTRADAEDVLQDAWLRWQRSDTDDLRSAEAWLVTVVTRLAINRLRDAKVEREAYVGWWLPEPLVAPDTPTPEAAAEMADELSLALLWVLERLAPEERAAFLLRQVFDYDYADVATLLDKTESACRQMVHRAAQRVKQEQPRFQVSPDAHRRLLGQFMQAVQHGDATTMKAMLAEDVQLIGDGGGKVPTFREPLLGAQRVSDLYLHVARRFADQVVYRMAQVNGEPGLLRYIRGQLESVQAFACNGEQITGIYVIRNPDKLVGALQLP